MAICKECKGDRFDHIRSLYDRTYQEETGFFSSRYIEKTRRAGALWQCRKCKRVFYYRGLNWDADGYLPINEEEV